MATWNYREKYKVNEFFGEEEYELAIDWNTTSDSGALFLYPNHSDEKERAQAYFFGPEQIDVLIGMLKKIKKDHCY